jgi:hypothetical protein
LGRTELLHEPRSVEILVSASDGSTTWMPRYDSATVPGRHQRQKGDPKFAVLRLRCRL